MYAYLFDRLKAYVDRAGFMPQFLRRMILQGWPALCTLYFVALAFSPQVTSLFSWKNEFLTNAMFTVAIVAGLASTFIQEITTKVGHFVLTGVIFLGRATSLVVTDEIKDANVARKSAAFLSYNLFFYASIIITFIAIALILDRGNSKT